MCVKKQFNYCPSSIDPCIRVFVRWLQSIGVETLGSCCGHGRYPMTIVVRDENGGVFDAVSGKVIPRVKRFYRKDSDGYYYIPEVSEPVR